MVDAEDSSNTFTHSSNDLRWREPFDKLERDIAPELGVNKVTLAYIEFVGPTKMDAARTAAAEGVEIFAHAAAVSFRRGA